MAKITVKCFPSAGFDGVFRAGRKWLAAGTDVETSTEEGDKEEGGKLTVGTKTMKALENDGRFSFGISGTVKEIEGVRSEAEALRAENADLKAQLAKFHAGAVETVVVDHPPDAEDEDSKGHKSPRKR